MTAKKLKAKAPFFWKTVEDGVYLACKNALLTDETSRRIAGNAAFIATHEFVSRAGK